jgi:GNAT superfamily N-acetyltransferase
VLTDVLAERGVPFLEGKTWTTDAPYRETTERIARRRQEGCLTVEMETSALTAVARFRGVSFAQYLYAGDDVSGEAWDHRRWNTASARTDLFWLAVEAAARLAAAGRPEAGQPIEASSGIAVRGIRPDERAWLRGLIEEEWGLPVVSTSGAHDPSELPALIAHDGPTVLGAVTYRMSDQACEVVTINSLRPGLGVGTALLAAVRNIAEQEGRRLWLITTNENLRAINFYQRRGMDMVALHRNFVDEVARWKPGLLSDGTPPFRHAIEFSY